MGIRRKHGFGIIAVITFFYLSFHLSCISDFTANALQKQITSYVVKPGKRYHVVFSDSVAAFYRSISADSLIYVMLHPMFKPAAIIKADDFVGTRQILPNFRVPHCVNKSIIYNGALISSKTLVPQPIVLIPSPYWHYVNSRKLKSGYMVNRTPVCLSFLIP